MKSKTKPAINVVAGLIFRDGRLLICQRHHTGPFPLKWEFPGGKLEGEETDRDALRRELREELAIDMLDARLAWQDEHWYLGGPGVALRFYNVVEFSGEPCNLVFEQISWVTLGALKDFDFLEGDRNLVDQLSSVRGVEIVGR